HMLVSNAADYRVAVNRNASDEERSLAWKRLTRRRTKAVRLIEELNLRTNKITPLLGKLREVSQRMDSLLEQISKAEAQGGTINGQTVEELRQELRALMRITLETPHTLRR